MPVTAGRCARPPRPHLPPLLVAGLVLWGSAAALWPFLRTASADVLGAAGAAAAALAIVLGVCALRRAHDEKAPIALLAFLSVACAVSLCAFWAAALHGQMGSTAGEGGGTATAWRAVLTEDARRGDFGWHAKACLVDSAGRRLSVRLNLPDGEPLLQGDALEVRGALRGPSAAASEYYWNAGLAGSLTVSDGTVRDAAVPSRPPLVALRRQVLDLIEEYAGDSSALLQALVCGWRPPIEKTGLYDQFRTVGLAHLVAVSGAHLSIVTALAAGVLRMLRLDRRLLTIACSLFLAGYVFFTGVPISALRAALMAATGLFSLLTDRRSSALSALGLCLVIFVGLDPPCALSASFALSAGSTLGIVLFAPLLSSAFEGKSLLKRAVGDPLALTAASALATQPYAAALFSQLPLLTPVANLVAGPLFTLACLAGFPCALCAWALPAAAPWLIGAAALACDPLSVVTGALASLPGTCLPIDAAPAAAAALSCALCAILWVVWPPIRIRGLVAAAGGVALALAMARAPLAASDAIVMLDVGQGDAFLVRSQGRSLLVDTGNQDGLLKAAFARQRVTGLDAVAVTHSDDDHCGSLPALGEVAPANSLLAAGGLYRCPCKACTDFVDEAGEEGYGDRMIGLALGDTLRCGRFALTVVWPEELADEGGNADSLCLLCEWYGDGDDVTEWTALLVGDAEAEQLHQLADRLPADGIDVLKVGHHGSRRSLDAALVERLAPSIALVSVGEGNRYGHPSDEALDLLEAAGCATYRTDESGDVSVAFSEDKLTVSTQRREERPR